MDPNAQHQAGASGGQEDYLDKGKLVIYLPHNQPLLPHTHTHTHTHTIHTLPIADGPTTPTLYKYHPIRIYARDPRHNRRFTTPNQPNISLPSFLPFHSSAPSNP